MSTIAAWNPVPRILHHTSATMSGLYQIWSKIKAHDALLIVFWNEGLYALLPAESPQSSCNRNHWKVGREKWNLVESSGAIWIADIQEVEDVGKDSELPVSIQRCQ